MTAHPASRTHGFNRHSEVRSYHNLSSTFTDGELSPSTLTAVQDVVSLEMVRGLALSGPIAKNVVNGQDRSGQPGGEEWKWIGVRLQGLER